MQIGRIRTIPENVLGPGYRIGIWLRGCSRFCPGCMSTDLQAADATCDMPVSLVLQMAVQLWRTGRYSGWTLSGGEPIDQLPELVELISNLHVLSSDILLYTGYTRDEVKNKATDEQWKVLGNCCAAMVYGPYLKNENDGIDPLKGSTNQKIEIKSNYCLQYEPFLNGKIQRKREIQTNVANTEWLITGML